MIVGKFASVWLAAVGHPGNLYVSNLRNVALQRMRHIA